MDRTFTSNGRRVRSRQQSPTPAPTVPSAPSPAHAYDWSSGQYNEELLSQLYSLGFGPEGPLRTFGFTSAKRCEGVTTVACNLALFAADCHGLRVLLVDGNHSNPKLHSVFRLNPSPGLAELLTEDSPDLSECIQDLSSKPLECWPAPLRQALRRSRVRTRQSRSREDASPPRLSILPAGRAGGPPWGMHGSRAGNPLDRISDHFDLVIVDLPAVESAKGCGFPLTDLGGILLVLKAESTSDIVARKGLQQLARNGGKVLGIVFNQRRTHLPEWIDKRLGD